MIKQRVIKRDKKTVDEGTMGFSDYVLRLEDFEAFVNRVTEEANNIDGYVLNIQYIESTDDHFDLDSSSQSYIAGAVIVYNSK